MIGRSIGWRDQHEEQLNLFAIDAVEVDAFEADANSSDRIVNAGVFGVRNSDAATDAGAAQFLSLQNGLNNVFLFTTFDLS